MSRTETELDETVGSDAQVSLLFRRHLWRYLTQIRGIFFCSLVLLFLIAGLTAAKALLIKPIVDTYLAERDVTWQQLWLLCGIVLAIFIVQSGCTWAYIVLSRIATASLVRSMRRDLFSHLKQHSLGFFSTHPSSDLTSRLTNDLTVFENSAAGSLQTLIRDFVVVTCLLSVMLYLNVKLALMTFLFGLVVGFVLRTANRRIHALGRRSQDELSSVARQLSEMVAGIDLILSFGLASRWQDRFNDANERYYRSEVAAQRASAMSVGLVLLIMGLGLTGTLLITGRALVRDEMTPGALGSFIAVFYLMLGPVQSISASMANLSRGLAAGARALELLETPHSMQDAVAGIELPAPPHPIHIDNVSFSYGQTPVLQDISLEIAPAEFVVMVGDSGAGKSTVAKLVLRFYDPQQGQIRINGTSLPDIHRQSLYRTVSYVGQDVFLFDASVDFNLRVGRPDASQDEVRNAIVTACADEFLDRLPDGLDTVVGERGVRLSGGQRQRIALARAILAETPVLVLDEATSALDSDLEKRILQNLIDLPADRTILAISHRLALAEVAHRVVVMKQGRIVEVGTAAELVKKEGEYARLWQASREALRRE